MTGYERTREEAAAKATAMSDVFPGSFAAMPEKDFYASIDDESVLEKYSSPRAADAGETPDDEISFRQVIDAIKTRYGDPDRLSLYEPTNAKYWGIDQLADAICFDGLSLDDPIFRIDRDTIHERAAIDDIEFNISYTVKICAPDIPDDEKRYFRIAYRNGGTENFTWQTILGKFTGQSLRSQRAEIERMGYPTIALADGEPLPTVYGVEHWNDFTFRRIPDDSL